MSGKQVHRLNGSNTDYQIRIEAGLLQPIQSPETEKEMAQEPFKAYISIICNGGDKHYVPNVICRDISAFAAAVRPMMEIGTYPSYLMPDFKLIVKIRISLVSKILSG